jgi:hypothetical protein
VTGTRIRYRASRLAPLRVRERWTRRLVARSEREIAGIAGSSQPIVLGPWLSEVGFELLYWIPFLRRLVERYELDPDRLVAVSRGGVDSWYEGLTSHYIEALRVVTPREVLTARARRIARTGSEKHMEIDALDKNLFRAGADAVGGEAAWLHPRLLYRLMYWTWTYGDLRPFERHTLHRRIPARDAVPDLPPPYTALKAYFSPTLSDTAVNREHLRRLTEALAEQETVVVLDSGIDDHAHWHPRVDDRVRILRADDPAENLDVQTRAVAHASRLVTTYGGFTYLGTYLAKTTHSFYGEKWFNPVHERALALTTQTLGNASTPSPRPIEAIACDMRKPPTT